MFVHALKVHTSMTCLAANPQWAKRMTDDKKMVYVNKVSYDSFME